MTRSSPTHCKILEPEIAAPQEVVPFVDECLVENRGSKLCGYERLNELAVCLGSTNNPSLSRKMFRFFKGDLELKTMSCFESELVVVRWLVLSSFPSSENRSKIESSIFEQVNATA